MSVQSENKHACGTVHVNMVATSTGTSAVLLLHVAAVAGNVEGMQAILAEISDTWP